MSSTLNRPISDPSPPSRSRSRRSHARPLSKALSSVAESTLVARSVVKGTVCLRVFGSFTERTPRSFVADVETHATRSWNERAAERLRCVDRCATSSRINGRAAFQHRQLVR